MGACVLLPQRLNKAIACYINSTFLSQRHKYQKHGHGNSGEFLILLVDLYKDKIIIR